MTDSRQQAEALVREAQEKHLSGDVDDALALYARSIETCPTAEAYTFRGWAYSSKGALDAAIADCKRAIELDPEFGNPYNDIGSYLMKQGSPDEAIEWLDRAKIAHRYESRHYPFINLGRIYAAKGQFLRALDELEGALMYRPEDADCLRAIATLRAKIQ
jgi:Tfp pilus assembly protein PilF